MKRSWEMFVKSRMWVVLKTISVLILSFADAKLFYHNNICGNKTCIPFRENRHCYTEVLQMTPAIRTVPEVPIGLFGRQNQL